MTAAVHIPRPQSEARPLRAWQREALERYRAVSAQGGRDFLAVATPGAGKTTFALTIAAELLTSGEVRAVTVIAPTEHLKRQWADAATAFGVTLDPNFSNSVGATSRDYKGVVLTYAQVAAHPALHLARTRNRPTLVILDEIHHAGDARSWGDATREAFSPARRRLALTGTPFRSDVNPIPFVTYLPDHEGVRRSVADSSYGYAEALRDGVVRPVIFMAYSGEMSWRTSAGAELTARLGEPLTNEQTAAAWRTALDPKGNWIPAVLAAADTRLTLLRQGGMADAGGLVIASDHANARAYAKLLHQISGTEPTVVLSDDPTASNRIETFRTSNARWMVAVRMVSEGVDVPRLAVGVYATSIATPLFFAQAVGRFVRGRGRSETASVFLPSVPQLLDLARQMEIQRDHALDKPLREPEAFDDEALRRANRRKDTTDKPDTPFTALESSAELEQVIIDGEDIHAPAAPGSPEEVSVLGLFGLLEPDEQPATLRHQAAKVAAENRRRAMEAEEAAQRLAVPPQAPPADADRPMHEVIRELRRELNTLVAANSHRTGRPHGMIHSEVRRTCGGPPSPQATAEQLRARIATLRKWNS